MNNYFISLSSYAPVVSALPISYTKMKQTRNISITMLRCGERLTRYDFSTDVIFQLHAKFFRENETSSLNFSKNKLFSLRKKMYNSLHL